MSDLGALARLFTRLGTVAFGGPAAHIALMQDEVVERNQWMTRQRFLDLVGATNLIPGPNSTELAIHIGRERAGWPGLLVAGSCFIVPSTVFVLFLAWLYVRYGATPAAESLLYGVEPVMIAIVLRALVKLAPDAVKNIGLGVVAALVLGAYLAGLNELALLFGAGAVVLVARNVVSGTRGRASAVVGGPLLAQAVNPGTDVSLAGLFGVFLKVGAVLYGSGYVLLALLRSDLVERLGLLTEQQLIDAVAVGQVTPGPVSTTATFIGYVLAGTPGALLATLGIFLPSFVFVALTNPLVSRLRRSETFSALLDGVNAAALALMAGVTVQLGRVALVDAVTIAIGVTSAALLFGTRVNSAWLIGAGGAVGLAVRLV